MLTADELTAIRAQIAQMLPDTGYILNDTAVSDGQGGFTHTWGTASTTAYRLDPMRGIETVAGAAVQPYHTFTLTLPYNAALTTSNRFKDAGGVVYSVTAIDTPKSWLASVRATVERI